MTHNPAHTNTYQFDSTEALWSCLQEAIGQAKSRHQGLNITVNGVTLTLSCQEADCDVVSMVNSSTGVKSLNSDVSGTTVDYSASYDHLELYGDGGSRGNPGPAASGFVLRTLDKQVIVEGGTFLGHATNNQAEYQSLIDGIGKALEMGVKQLSIYMDSQLAVRQVMGQYRVKNEQLIILHRQVMELLGRLESYEISHVPRELNKEADAMANKIMDANG